MNFLGIGTGELLLILLIVLLVMGPERLPQLIREWAKVVRTLSQFTRTWQQFNAEMNRQLNLEELVDGRPRPRAKAAPPSPSAPPGPADNVIAPPDLAQTEPEGQPETATVEPAQETDASHAAANDASSSPAAPEAFP